MLLQIEAPHTFGLLQEQLKHFFRVATVFFPHWQLFGCETLHYSQTHSLHCHCCLQQSVGPPAVQLHCPPNTQHYILALTVLLHRGRRPLRHTGLHDDRVHYMGWL